MTKIILVRHCEAEGNTNGVFQGRTDSDISGNSAQQLELVSLRLRNEPIDAIYASPLIRAYKTAEAINQYHHLPIETDARLTEIDVGDWEGRSWAEIERENSPAFRMWEENPGTFQAPGGESMLNVRKRMWAAISEIAINNPGKLVCVASHGCAIRNFLCKALNKPIEEINDIGWCDNTGISVVEMDVAGHTKVLLMNDSSHIPPELSVYQNSDSEVAP